MLTLYKLPRLGSNAEALTVVAVWPKTIRDRFVPEITHHCHRVADRFDDSAWRVASAEGFRVDGVADYQPPTATPEQVATWEAMPITEHETLDNIIGVTAQEAADAKEIGR